MTETYRLAHDGLAQKIKTVSQVIHVVRFIDFCRLIPFPVV